MRCQLIARQIGAAYDFPMRAPVDVEHFSSERTQERLKGLAPVTEIADVPDIADAALYLAGVGTSQLRREQ